MALRMIEGFESFGPAGTTSTTLENALRRKYSRVTTAVNTSSCVEVVAGWHSGLALEHLRNDGNEYFWGIFDEQTTWIVGFAFKTPPTLNGAKRLVSWCTREDDVQCSLWLMHDFRLSFGRYYSTQYLLGFTDRTLQPSTWYYIECKVYIHDTAGEAEVRVNGVTELSLTNQDTRHYSAYVGAGQVWFDLGVYDKAVTDDIYVADGQPGLDTFIGPCKVECLRPNGDDNADWDPSTPGNHYELVDDAGEPNATDYVEGDTLDELDLWDYEALSYIVGNVKGVQVNTAVQLDEAGSTRKVRTPCKSGTTQSDGDGTALATDSYVVLTRLLPSDPDTGSDWTVGGVNAAKCGVKVGD